MKLKTFWVEKMAILNPSISSYVALENVFDDGVRCYRADEADVAIVQAKKNGEFNGFVSAFLTWLIIMVVVFGGIFATNLVKDIIDAYK